MSDIDELLKLDKLEKKVLLQLLDEQKQKEGHVLAVRAKMGGMCSFVTSVTLRWVAARVKFAMDLPGLKENTDETGKVVIDATTLDLLQQREPDWRREFSMVRYMVKEGGMHKFPPILVTAMKRWVSKPKSDKWDDGKATESSVSETHLNSEGTYLDLYCNDTEFYALDGQHRLMAILGLDKLLKEGKLYALKQNGERIKHKFIPEKEDETYASPKYQTLMDESIGIEIIPAVMKGESSKKAQRRLRSIFLHVNKHAKKTTKGENALLDEDDGFCIVARTIMIEHKLFHGRRVDTKSGKLAESSKYLTTLETLVTMAREYLGPDLDAWEPEGKDDVPNRPDEDEIRHAVDKFSNYFDLLCKLPSHYELTQDQKLSCKEFRKEDDKENIFFRPIAQMALAEAMAKLNKERKNLDEVMKVLVEKEKEGELRLRKKESIWYGVLWDVNQQQMRHHVKYQKLCANLLVHLLGGGTEEKARAKLLKAFANARKVVHEEKKEGPVIEHQYVNRDGETVKGIENVELPSPW